MHHNLFHVAKSTRAKVILASVMMAGNAWAWTPFIDILSPASAAPGSGPLSLTISGANFIPGAVVNFNGVKLTPDSFTTSRLHVTVPASSLATAQTANVTVVNPDTAPLNGASNVVFFPIRNPTPTISTVVEPPLPVTGSTLWQVIAADFNGDGRQDVAVFPAGAGTAIVYLGDGKGGFTAAISSTNTCSVSETSFAVAADFNGDGKLDLACAGGSGGENGVEILLGGGTGGFTIAGTAQVVERGPLVVGDFKSRSG